MKYIFDTLCVEKSNLMTESVGNDNDSKHNNSQSHEDELNNLMLSFDSNSSEIGNLFNYERNVMSTPSVPKGALNICIFRFIRQKMLLCEIFQAQP